MEKRWGPGITSPPQGEVTERVYRLDPYPRVVVSIAGRRVASISVQLDKPYDAPALAKQLHAEHIDRVTVYDDNGQPLGESLPERGMLLRLDPASQKITHLLLEPIDAEPFVSRATANGDVQVRRSLQDLDYAIHLDAKNATAHYVKAQILAQTGRYDDAERSIEAAIALNALNPAYLLSQAEILGHLQRHAEALKLVDQILSNPKLPAMLKARALCQQGDLKATGPSADYQGAIEAHTASIKTAQTLADDDRSGVRRQAKRTMLEAHLGAAGDVANGNWRQKNIVAERWIARADALSQELVEREEADPVLRLTVARRVLDVRAALEGARWDSSDWTAAAILDAKQEIEASEDPLRRQRLEWELGQALFDVAEMEPSQSFSEATLSHCDEIMQRLERGAEHRQRTAEDDYLLGRVYAHIGSVHAVYRLDHVVAAEWFDRAAPLLDRPLPAAATGNLARHAETFVAMGISYWEIGRREDGVRLTQLGVELLKKATAAKLIDSSEMAIPYGNLASMYRELGRSDQARNFAELASRIETPKRR